MAGEVMMRAQVVGVVIVAVLTVVASLTTCCLGRSTEERWREGEGVARTLFGCGCWTAFGGGQWTTVKTRPAWCEALWFGCRRHYD